jgi:DNA-binding NarL/FixJ family response regulator
MSGFYVSLIFIGIMLSIISIILILIDKKNVFVFNKTFDDKKQELVEIINDAEQMIDELNRFSDYIVSQIDVKSEELNAHISAAEKRIMDLEERAAAVIGSKRIVDVRIEDHVQSNTANAVQAKVTEEAAAETACAADVVLPAAAINAPARAAAAYSSRTGASAASKNRKEKVIPFSSKYSEVLRLSKEGMEDTEIAKSLNMGKGEVELIIGLKR